MVSFRSSYHCPVINAIDSHSLLTKGFVQGEQLIDKRPGDEAVGLYGDIPTPGDDLVRSETGLAHTPSFAEVAEDVNLCGVDLTINLAADFHTSRVADLAGGVVLVWCNRDNAGNTRAMIEQDLATIGSEFGGFGGPDVGDGAVDRDTQEGDAAASDADTVHGLFNENVPRPAIAAIDPQGRVGMLRVADSHRRALAMEVFDAGLGQQGCTGGLSHFGAGRIQVASIERICKRDVQSDCTT